MSEFGDETKSAINSPLATDLFDLSPQSSRFESLKWAQEVAQMQAKNESSQNIGMISKVATTNSSHTKNVNFYIWGIALILVAGIAGVCCQFLVGTTNANKTVSSTYPGNARPLKIQSAALTPEMMNEKTASF